MSETTERLRELLARAPEIDAESAMRERLRGRGMYADDAELMAAAVANLADLLYAAEQGERLRAAVSRLRDAFTGSGGLAQKYGTPAARGQAMHVARLLAAALAAQPDDRSAS